MFVLDLYFQIDFTFLSDGVPGLSSLWFDGGDQPIRFAMKLIATYTWSGWWFGTWTDYFSIYWEESSQLTFIFFRGVETTNQWLIGVHVLGHNKKGLILANFLAIVVSREILLKKHSEMGVFFVLAGCGSEQMCLRFFEAQRRCLGRSPQCRPLSIRDLES